MLERIIHRMALLRSEGRIHAKNDSWSLAWNRYGLYLTEAPVTSPKDPLRALDPDRKGKAVMWTWSHELFPSQAVRYPILSNVFPRANIKTTDTANQVRSKLEDAFDKHMDFLRSKGAEAITISPNWLPSVREWLDGVSRAYPDSVEWYKSYIAPAEFVPRTMKPIKAQGKDFEILVQASNFRVYSQYESHGGGDDSYSGFGSKSPAAARKLYVLLQKNPSALAQVTMNQFSTFLRNNKIPYDYLSSWH